MRDAEDLEEFESWPDEEPPPRPCPECGDDDRHMPDCSRNYRTMSARRQAIELSNTYWLGYRHGQRTADYSDLDDREPALKLELRLIGTTNRAHRAFALGELRGYRQAAGRPSPIMEGHRLLP